MKRILKFFASLIIGLIVFFIVLAKIGFETLGQALSLFFNLQGLVIVGISLIFFGLGILKWKTILKSQGYNFKFLELSPVWLLGFSISYITPFAIFGGEIFRMYFAKKKFKELSWKNSMSSVAIDKLLDTTVFFGFLIISLLVFAFYGRFPTSIVGIAVLSTAGLFLCLLGIFYFKKWQKQSAIEWLIGLFGLKKEKFSNGRTMEDILEAEKQVFEFFSFKKKVFWKTLGLTLLRYFLHFVRCVILVLFVVGNFTVLKSLALYGFTSLATLTPLPATLGALEIGEGIAFKVLGLGFNNGAVFSMIWRGADLLICLFGLLFLIKFGALWAEERVLRKIERK